MRGICEICGNSPPRLLLDACLLLMAQYDSSGDFVMGGNLTNEPFLKIREAISQAMTCRRAVQQEE